MSLIDTENSISNNITAEETKLIVRDLFSEISNKTTKNLLKKIKTLIMELNLETKSAEACGTQVSLDQDLYAIHFESMDLNIKNEKLKVFIGFGIDLNVQKSLLGFWLYDPEEAPYHFWLRVCEEIKSSGVRSIEKKVTDSFYWLEEAMDKVFKESVK